MKNVVNRASHRGAKKNCCKSLRIRERQLRSKQRKPRKPQPFLWFKFDPDDHRQLILSNGTRLRQAYDGVGLFLSQGGSVYALTQLGLRNRRVNFWKKNTYCKPLHSGRGCSQGQNYPYVEYHGRTYRIHRLMAHAWLGGIPDGMVPDHINGNIDDFRKSNLRVITVEENDRCGGIIKRLRNAAKKYHLPLMDPSKRTPEDMLALYDRFESRNLDEAMYEEIERQKVLQKLRESAVYLHDPSLDPKNIEPERLEKILSTLRVEDTKDIMEWEERS